MARTTAPPQYFLPSPTALVNEARALCMERIEPARHRLVRIEPKARAGAAHVQH